MHHSSDISAFQSILVDLEARQRHIVRRADRQQIAAYDDPRGVDNWIRLTRSPSYTCFEDCRTALSALLVSPFWRECIRKRDYKSITDLGVGGGEKLCLILEAAKQHETLSDILFVDISQPMLKAAFENITSHGWHTAAPQSLKAVRLDFSGRKMIKLRRDRRLPVYDSGNHIFFLLGSTLANYEERHLLDGFRLLMRPGDILVVGVEFWKLDSGDIQQEGALLKPYESDAYEMFWAEHYGLEDVPRCADFVEVTLEEGEDLSSIKQSKTIVTSIVADNAKRRCTKSTRYDERQLIAFFEESYFRHAHSVKSPRNGFYQHLIFEKV